MRILLMMLVALVLAACGAGGGEEETVNNNTPEPAPQSGEPTATLEVFVDEEGREFVLPQEEGEESVEEQIGALVESAQSTPQVRATFTPASEGALDVPLPQTLVASETEEVEPIPDFNRIAFSQQGGGNTIVFEILGDGRVVRDGQTYNIGTAQVAALNQAIDELNFFGLQGTFLGPPGAEEAYRYRVSVQAGDIERAITAQDGYIPLELRRFLGLIRDIGDSVIR